MGGNVKNAECGSDRENGVRVISRGRGASVPFAVDKMAASMLELLDILNIGVSFVGADCRLSVCNSKMMSLLSESSSIYLTASGHLASKDSRNASAIKSLLVSAVLGEEQSFSMHMLSTEDGQPAVILLFMSFRSHAFDVDDRPYAAVIAVDMLSSQLPYAAVLMSLFGLTPSEADAVEAIARGISTGEYAVAKGVSPNTVGAHLHHAMSKMKVSRQVDLVRIVLASLTWFSPETINNLVESSGSGRKQFQKTK